MQQIVKPIKGFPGYHIGNDGTMWTSWRQRARRNGGRGSESYICDSLRQMKLKKHSNGYACISIRKDGKYYDFLVHRLVLETFVGPCPENMECLHGDGNKTNNNVDNLRWGTRVENIQDSIDHGVFYRATEAAAIANRGRRVPDWVRRKISDGHKRRREKMNATNS